MIVEIERNGRRHAVDVRREGEGWVVVVDGRELTASTAGPKGPALPEIERVSLLVGPVVSDRPGAARSYEVAIERRGAAHVVHVNGQAVTLSIADPFKRARRDADGTGGEGPAKIVAPMPGRIVKVLVKAGDHVEAHHGLVVVEAMKMENELRAPRPGTVSEVRVREGMSVEAAAVLVVIE